ncbi:hypothetical protein ACHAXA_009370, partial [Cyclostephanos tholiformis]
TKAKKREYKVGVSATMAFLPLLVLLISAPYAVTSNTPGFKHRARRKRHFSTATSSLAFQSHLYTNCGGGDKSHGTCPNHHNNYPFHRTSGRIDANSETFAPEASEDTVSSTLTPLTSQYYIDVSRRAAVLRIFSLTILSAGFPNSSLASEIDATGQLFTPKNEMIKGGGSASARGIRLKPVEEKKSRNRRNNNLLKSSGLIQNVYETRFITYLARFLLVFDPSANAWWKKNSMSPDVGSTKDSLVNNDISKERFAEFAESVEVGLADYFSGPYGSYASIAAAKAGIAAAEPAKSVTRAQSTSRSKSKSRKAEKEAINLARQGILNLFTLLKARYTSMEAKQQLAILFSLIPSPELQPVQEIRGLLGEVDNGTIAAVELFDLSDDDEAVEGFRLSSRHGGGFSKSDNELIRVEAPAPLGDEYKPAKLRAVMKPTSRILRINVIDGGLGYTVSPDVIVKQRGATRDCEACAIIDRKGSVSEIILIDPGFGYGGLQNREGSEPTLPTVEIRQRMSRQNNPDKEVKPAKAVPELEYSVVGVEIIDGGSGYIFDQPPKVALILPQTDPDWFATPITLQDTEDDDENQVILASVTQMKSGGDGIIVDPRAVRRGRDNFQLGDDLIRKIKSDPISLLPPVVRPQYSKFIDDASPSVSMKGYYYISSLPPIKQEVVLTSSKYRSIDPLFGPLGKAPVIKNAMTLSSSQYFRLAISGALCTVLVRTLLNPLELVKTKIQLGNDEEIIKSVRNASLKHGRLELNDKPNSGTLEVIKRMIEVRGPLSLFQSADITLLTSVVFGLFGFGATELFRRSFSAVFFDETAAGPSEFLLLAAAALATLLTCAFGAPFEILRVRSMSTAENQGIKKVFEDFVEENRLKRHIEHVSISSSLSTSVTLPKGMQLEDIKPLWSSFIPIASRELPFALTKFLVFDLASSYIADFINGSNLLGDDEIRVGVGGLGLLLSAFAGALAGIAGAFVSHPADLILTLTSASSREDGQRKDWRMIVQELLAAEGGISNMYAGFPARAVFFFLVIGLQFFLYDYIKTLLDVGTDDLTLVLDVFYAVRQGLL